MSVLLMMIDAIDDCDDDDDDEVDDYVDDDDIYEREEAWLGCPCC